MNKIKKIIKSILAASLFVVGLVCNPLNIKAEEASTYGAVKPSYVTETYVFNASAGGVYGGLITLDVTWNYFPMGDVVSRKYYSAACDNQDANACSFTVSQSGNSTNEENTYYYVTFTINNRYNGNNYTIKYRITIQRNNIMSKTVLSVTKK